MEASKGGTDMKITTFRIDDRLIHGQVVTAWIAHSDACLLYTSYGQLQAV